MKDENLKVLMRQILERQQVQLIALLALIAQQPPKLRESFASTLRTNVGEYLEAPISGPGVETDALVTGLLSMFLEAAGQPPSHG